MNSTDSPLPQDAQRVLDGHLAAVRAALETSGTPVSDARGICDDLEAQAREMYFARADDKPPRQAMYAVLAELDDPIEFGMSSVEVKRPKRRRLPKTPFLQTMLIAAVTIPVASILFGGIGGGEIVIILLIGMLVGAIRVFWNESRKTMPGG